MVYSIGVDLVDIGRISKGYNRFHKRYLDRLFSKAEIEIIMARKTGMKTTMAGKFAAKEAVMKALGIFFDSGVSLKDIEVLNYPNGMPYIKLPPRITKEIEGKKVIVSISHEKKYAVGMAVIIDED
jgi:holo-[acyl-carrier protein] synthase